MSLVSARTIVKGLKFVVVHKLTNQPVRSHYKPFNIIEHESIEKANEVCSMKNKISGADFYKVEQNHPIIERE